MSVSAEWVQLGKGKKGKPVYYRKKEIYTMDWTEDNVNLSECLVAAATYGGPIALTRDPRKMLRVKSGDSKQYIYIYSCSGKLLSKFEWQFANRGSLVHIGFSDEESLICVTDEAQVFLYDLLGKAIFQFSFVSDVKDSGVLKVTTWGNGVAILTKDFRVFVVTDLDAPFCEQLSTIPVSLDFDDEKEIAMCVIPPEQSQTNQIEIILGVPQSKSIYLVSSEKCTDMKLSNGPFAKISASPSGDALATFTEEGSLWVVKSDFTENHAEFNTKSNAPPHQVAWCGEDSVCLYWEPEQINREGQSLLLMIGPNGDYQKFSYEGPIFMVTEIDGVRIITNDGCEFLQRVPNPTFDIFQIGSMTPSAVLFDAYTEFEKKNASSIKNIRNIRPELVSAVKSCLSAAANEFDHTLQRKLLKAAAYGKSFCEDFDHASFVETCKKLRVMNAVRDYMIGIPITFAQFERLTAKVLIDRLVNRQHYYLAYRLCDYLRIKPASVLVHWACAKVRQEGVDDEVILTMITEKLKRVEGVSYANVASMAHRVGKKALAIKLLEREERAGEQVPLLLNMGETRRALSQAIKSGETDLVYLVLLHMKKKMEPSKFFSIVNEKEFEIARNLLVTYCREQDLEFLKLFYHALELPHEAAAMNVYEAVSSIYAQEDSDLTTQKKSLVTAKDLYNKKKDFAVDAKACEDQVKLLEFQNKLDQTLGKKVFSGLSLSDTIYNCILIGDKSESKLKSDFKVPDKRYWWIKIAAYSKLEKWDKLEKFSKQKSPVGFRPFVEACMARGNNVEALKYIPRVTDTWEKVELYVELQRFKEAIETAFAQQDSEMLKWIRSKTTNNGTKKTIDDLMQKLGH